jgi:NAD(P)H-flavin reductase
MIELAQDPMRPRIFRIRRIANETADTFTFDLEHTDGRTEFPFAAGQFNMLYLPGTGEIPVSISGDPGKPGLLTHTVRTVGTVTKEMRKLRRGDEIGVRGPLGTGWPVEAAEGNDLVVVAGGIGLAPLRSVLYLAMVQRERFGRVILLFGTRTPADIPFQRELEKWRGRLDLEVLVTVDRATPSWRGNVGVVTTLIPKASFDPSQTTAFICGPEVMMRFTALELGIRGVPEENIYISMERNMKCGIGLCGHCQFGPFFICKDGPVFRLDHIKNLLALREI